MNHSLPIDYENDDETLENWQFVFPNVLFSYGIVILAASFYLPLRGQAFVGQLAVGAIFMTGAVFLWKCVILLGNSQNYTESDLFNTFGKYDKKILAISAGLSLVFGLVSAFAPCVSALCAGFGVGYFGILFLISFIPPPNESFLVAMAYFPAVSALIIGVLMASQKKWWKKYDYLLPFFGALFFISGIENLIFQQSATYDSESNLRLTKFKMGCHAAHISCVITTPASCQEPCVDLAGYLVKVSILFASAILMCLSILMRRKIDS